MPEEVKNCLSCKYGPEPEVWSLPDSMTFSCRNEEALTKIPACVTICVSSITKRGKLLTTNYRNGGHAAVIANCPAYQPKDKE